jgi:hypothetical protein
MYTRVILLVSVLFLSYNALSQSAESSFALLLGSGIYFFQSDFISIARSNDIAVNNRIRHITIIPEVKQKGLLKVI